MHCPSLWFCQRHSAQSGCLVRPQLSKRSQLLLKQAHIEAPAGGASVPPAAGAPHAAVRGGQARAGPPVVCALGSRHRAQPQEAGCARLYLQCRSGAHRVGRRHALVAQLYPCPDTPRLPAFYPGLAIVAMYAAAPALERIQSEQEEALVAEYTAAAAHGGDSA